MVKSISEINSKLYVLTQFLHSLVFTIPIWIVYYQDRISISEISFLIAFQYAIQVVGELPSGAFADLVGKRKTIIIGFLLAAISFLLFPLGTHIIHFTILAGLIGLSDSFLSGSVEAITYDSLKQDNKENLFSAIVAKQSFWYQIGLVIATISGGFLYELNEFLPYILYAVCLISACLLSLSLIEPKVDTLHFTLGNYLLQIKEGFKEISRDNHTRLISLFYILVGTITWTCALYFNQFMFVELGFSDSNRGMLEGGLRLINVFILMRLLKNEHIFTRNVSFLFFPVIMIIGLLPGILLSGYFGLPFIALAMMASTARWIVLTKYTNEVFSSRYRATAISALSMLIGILYVAITLVSGPIIELFSVKMMYTILGVVTIFTVLPLSFLLIKTKATV